MRSDWITPRLEKAMRWSALCHLGQTRKGSDVPYFEHAAAVALILDRAGFDEDVVIAGLLHDVVEDTAATLEDVGARFGPDVREMVQGCSEVKLDAEGRKRPWIDRKRDHLAALVGASNDGLGRSFSPTNSTTSRASTSTWRRDNPSGLSSMPSGRRSSGITARRSTPSPRDDPRHRLTCRRVPDRSGPDRVARRD